ncbi:MAG: NAD(P)-dependent oxidoreductase, partial [Candidatus Undinarchaeales archaeon]|nr:NAD(P)-dependent oxidoreductase [Candidatus Undinarchaeales archaeon]
KRGHTVLGISDQDADVPWTHHTMELSSDGKLQDGVQSTAPDVLIHLAFVIGDDVVETRSASDVNEEITHTILKALKDTTCDIICASTCAVYGDRPEDCTTRSAPDPRSRYAQDKLTAESLLRGEAKRSGRGLSILRLGNVYGPGDERSVIAKILHAANDGRPFTIFSGERIRDYVYVDDVVSAFITAVEHQPSGVHTLNVGTGHGVDVRKLISIVRDLTKKNVLVREEDGPMDYVERCVLDIGETARILDWYPTVSLEDGIRSLWKHLIRI